MDPIRHCFEHHRHSLTKCLINADFSQDQVTRFLPGAATGLLESSRNTSLFQTLASLFSCSRYTLLRKIDIGSIARNTGMNPDQVTAGLHAIAPVLLHAIAKESRRHDSDMIHSVPQAGPDG